MVKLRVAVRAIPENSYLEAGEVASSSGALPGERRFLVIVRDPDEEYFIGTLAREVQERYRSLYKHDLGKIKYIKENDDDCDLDPEQLVYDVLIDEGRAASDPSDQHVTIKFIQEQGGPLRAGSVIPDLTPVHYQPRPRTLPPVPKFHTGQVLGKRASTTTSYESGGNTDEKRQRLTDFGAEQNGEDVPISSIETSDLHNGQDGTRDTPEQYFSPALAPSDHNGHLTNGLSLPKRFVHNQDLEAARTPITPPSDGATNGYLTGNSAETRMSLKSRSPAARAMSTGSKKFATQNPIIVASQIEDSQMSPNSKMKQPFRVPRNSSSAILSFQQIEDIDTGFGKLQDVPHLDSQPSQSATEVAKGSAGDAASVSQESNRGKPKQKKSVRRTKESRVSDISSRGSPVLDSPGEQLSNELLGSPYLIRDSQVVDDKPKTKPKQKRKSAIQSDGQDQEVETKIQSTKAATKEKLPKQPRKTTAKEQTDSAATPKLKATKQQKKIAEKEVSDAKGKRVHSSTDLNEIASNPTEGSISSSTAPSIRKAQSNRPGVEEISSETPVVLKKTKQSADHKMSAEMATPSGDNDSETAKQPDSTDQKGTAVKKSKKTAAAKKQAAAVAPTETPVKSAQGVLLADTSTNTPSVDAKNNGTKPEAKVKVDYSPVVPKGWTKEMYRQHQERLKANPLPPKPPKLKKAKTSPAPKADSAEEQESETSLSSRSSAERSQSPLLAAKEVSKSKSETPLESRSARTPLLKTPSATASRSSLPGNFPVGTSSEKAPSVTPSSHDDIMAKARARLEGLKSVSEAKVTPLKTIAASAKPASETTNRKIRAIGAEIKAASQKSIDSANPKKPVPVRSSLAALDTSSDEESSESDSEDSDEPPQRRSTIPASAVPDPTTRDKTPSTDEDTSSSGDDDEL